MAIAWKALKFTDGNQLWLYDFPEGDGYTYIDRNVVINVTPGVLITGYHNGAFLNYDKLNNKTMVDNAGNIWKFAFSDTTCTITINDETHSFNCYDSVERKLVLSCHVTNDGVVIPSIGRLTLTANTPPEPNASGQGIYYFWDDFESFDYAEQWVEKATSGQWRGIHNKFLIAESVFISDECYLIGSESGTRYRDWEIAGLPGSGSYTRYNTINLADGVDDLDFPLVPNDPYSPGGESEPGGGTGNFDGTSEDINIPDLPTLSAVDTGFISLFNPTAGELKNLANYLWGDVFDISTWKKIFADPMDAILGLSIVPVNVPSSGSSPVTIGNISTGVSMTKASSQYVSVDCGTINVNEYWGAYLDYSPYTQAEIYLPFIGIHPLTIDDIMGKPVHVVYHIDILSGACCAYVKCGGSVLYSFVGQCSCSIPITANDWTNVINGALSIAGAIGSMVASGGATAPMAISSMASTAVNSLKPNVEKSGSMGGMGGMLGVQKPYIILTRPKQALPAKQNTFTGYPSYITKKLLDCSGYTEIESIHLENVPATDNELSEITDLLKSGVII